MKRFIIALVALVGIIGAAVPSVFAGPVGGPAGERAAVFAYGEHRHTVMLYGGSLTEIGLVGDGDTDLDIYVYDENGNLVAFDVDPTDVCLVSFVPGRTGSFTIRVVNHGPVYNVYGILAQ